MTDEPAAAPAPAPARSVWKDVLGKQAFDDRIDTRPDIRTAEALSTMARSAKVVAAAPGLFTAKALLQLGMVVPGLYLPWLLRIVVDHAVRQEPFGTTEVVFPPFMAPVLHLVQGQPPLGVLLTMTLFFTALLVFFGSRVKPWSSELLQGQDLATQAENQLSAGNSTGGGVWGLLEFMVHVRLTQRLANHLRTRLFRRLAKLPMTALNDQRIGDSIYRVLYDVPTMPSLVYELTLAPFFALLSAVLNLYILQYSYGEVAPELVWIAWLTVPAAFLATYPFSGALRRASQNRRAAGAATTNAMEESLSNVAAVQSLGAGKRERERFATRSAESFRRERYHLAVILVSASVAFSALGVGTIYVTVLVTNRIIDGVMSVGDFAALMAIFPNIVLPAGYFGAYWIKLQDAIAAARRVFFFYDFPSEADRTGGVELPRVSQGVRLEGVSFAYPNTPDATDEGAGSAGNLALREVTLDFQVGELVAIVGPTGSGKTTLACLIPALLSPTAGRVLIDGRDAREIRLDDLRRQATYVFQEHVLLSDSIRENLLLGHPQASEAQLFAALETAGCMEFVRELPAGIDTVLGRAGDTLSVGQQQRLCIARGLVRDSSILILDEPTAALDPHTENLLVASLKAAAEHRLVIVIAHRLSTIRHADRIVFLDQGEVREAGNHNALMAKPNGAYREFVELQTT